MLKLDTSWTASVVTVVGNPEGRMQLLRNRYCVHSTKWAIWKMRISPYAVIPITVESNEVCIEA